MDTLEEALDIYYEMMCLRNYWDMAVVDWERAVEVLEIDRGQRLMDFDVAEDTDLSQRRQRDCFAMTDSVVFDDPNVVGSEDIEDRRWRDMGIHPETLGYWAADDDPPFHSPLYQNLPSWTATLLYTTQQSTRYRKLKNLTHSTGFYSFHASPRS
jgi:hypothetical protein